ncbi:hypothetical protein QQ045_025119 [Rhodiola kirilowii]
MQTRILLDLNRWSKKSVRLHGVVERFSHYGVMDRVRFRREYLDRFRHRVSDEFQAQGNKPNEELDVDTKLCFMQMDPSPFKYFHH